MIDLQFLLILQEHCKMRYFAVEVLYCAVFYFSWKNAEQKNKGEKQK